MYQFFRKVIACLAFVLFTMHMASLEGNGDYGAKHHITCKRDDVTVLELPCAIVYRLWINCRFFRITSLTCGFIITVTSPFKFNRERCLSYLHPSALSSFLLSLPTFTVSLFSCVPFPFLSFLRRIAIPLSLRCLII